MRRFGYDVEGRCSSRLDENGNLVRTVYNMDGSIHTAVTSYAYDSMGRLTGETLDGETACYSYDHAGSLTAEVHTAQSVPVTHMMRITGTPPYAVQVMCSRTIMMQKATTIPLSSRTRSQTLYIRVECSFTNWMKIKIRQGIMYLAMNISGWITTIT